MLAEERLARTAEEFNVIFVIQQRSGRGNS